ncbi:MAG: glycosyltransferase family 39 protein [Acidobacteria bacterium]|nr:glycosyltransferase family 39 protein [Acidobacteriota bacterium]MBI3656727.1 glycosyltransferase family 39 protein [Acidobacteriota bacterium]
MKLLFKSPNPLTWLIVLPMVSALLLAALLIRPEALIKALAGEAPPNFAHLRRGAQLFKLCLALDGLILLTWTLVRTSKVVRMTAAGRAAEMEGRSPPIGRLASLFPAPADSRLSRVVATRWLLGLLMAGTILRLINLNNDLWLDEIGSLIGYMRYPFGQIVCSYSSANQHLLYSLLAHAGLRLFGETPVAIRLPAVLFGVAGLWSVYRLARLTESRTDALFVVALMTVSYHHVFFSQNARGYTLFLGLSLISMVLFVRALLTNRTWLWTAYALITVLNMVNHLNAVFVFLGQIGTLALIGLMQRREPAALGLRLKRALAASLLIGFFTFHVYALSLPEMINYFATADRTAVGWPLLSLDFFKETVKGLQLGFSSGLAAIGVLILGLYGTAQYLRRHFYICVLFALPSLLGVAGVGLLNVGAYPRLFLMALPIGLLMLVRGACGLSEGLAHHLRFRSAATAGVGVIVAGAVVVSALALVPYYRMPKQDFTGALSFIEAIRVDSSSVAAADLASFCAQYYNPAVRAINSPGDLERLLREGRPVWLLYIFPASMKLRQPALYQYIEEHFTLIRQFPGTVGDGTVYVCRNKEAARNHKD